MKPEEADRIAYWIRRSTSNRVVLLCLILAVYFAFKARGVDWWAGLAALFAIVGTYTEVSYHRSQRSKTPSATKRSGR